MVNFNGFFEYIKKYILIAFVLFLSGLFGSCSTEDNITIISMYTVAFDSQSGSSVASQFVNKGLKATKPADPARAGYHFLGWVTSAGEEYDFDSVISNNLTLYASWDIMYTVTFNSVGGSSVESQANIGVFKATRPADPTRSDYDFLAWTNSAGEEYDFSADVTRDIVLGAQWIRLYVINLDFLNGSPVGSQSVREGSNVIAPPNPSRFNYDFVNWIVYNSGNSVYDFNAAVTNNVNLYAEWRFNSVNPSHTLNIKYNDGVTPEWIVRVASGDTLVDQNLPDPQHPDPAYDFYGWYTTALAEEGDEYDSNQAIRSDTTIYAKWLTDDLEKIVYLKKIPEDLSKYDQLTRNVLSRYKAGAEVEARFLDVGKSGSGIIWARASGDLPLMMESITDASEDKIYLVLMTAEVFSPNRHSLMKNHVAIIGGYNNSGNWKRYDDNVNRTRINGGRLRRLFLNSPDDQQGTYTEHLDRSALLYDVVIREGNISYNYYGHAMKIVQGSPILWKVTFEHNGISDYVQDAGGRGALSAEHYSYPLLIDCVFRKNIAHNGSALYLHKSSVIISNTLFEDNYANLVLDGTAGGAILWDGPEAIMNDKPSIIDGVTFKNHQARFGGAVKILGHTGVDRDTITPIYFKNVTFKGNSSVRSGAGLYIENSRALLENVTFENNEAPEYGGAVYNDGSSVVFLNTTFYRNKAQKGSVVLSGNLKGATANAPDLTFINVTAVDNNTTEFDGGDIHLSANWQGTEGGSTHLLNSLFYDANIIDKGTLVYIYIGNARAGNHHKLDLMYSVLDSATTNMSETSSQVKVKPDGGQYVDYTSVGSMSVNPNLGYFENHGGMVKTIPINSQNMKDAGAYVKWNKTGWMFYYSEDGSVWHNRADNLVIPLPTETVGLNNYDARGFDRDGRPDIGAYEVLQP